MEIKDVLEYFAQYGLLFLFVIVFLEYLNLPGLPAGIIMPAAGILIAGSELDFLTALIVSVAAGLLGSICLYILGYLLGISFLDKMKKKSKTLEETLDKTMVYVDKYQNRGIFITRLIPVARTLISAVVGALKVNFFSFVIYSTLGITIWNFVFIYAGYAFSSFFLKG